jgi:hypothetical protein
MGQWTLNKSVATAILEFLKLMTASLNGSQPLYWIATILRGPDEDDYNTSHVVKNNTTARVRGYLYSQLKATFPDVALPPGAINTTPLTATQLQERNVFLTKCSRRYAKHYTMAVAAIKEAFGYDLMTETDLTVPAKPVVDPDQSKAIFNVLNIIWNNSAIYNIIAALRSADTCAGSKDTSTCRVREFLNSMMKDGTPGTPLTAEQMKQRDVDLAKESQHYTNYYYSAVRAIQSIFGYDLLTETVVKK